MHEKRETKRVLLEQLNALRHRIAQLERALAERQDRGAGLFARFPEENPNPVLRISEDFTVLYANKASAPILETWRTRVGGKLPEACCPRVKEALNTSEASTFELSCDNGRTFMVALAPAVNDGYLNAYAIDITYRKKVEQDLYRSEEQYRSVVQDLPALVCRSLPDGTIVFANAAYCDYFGKTKEELVGSKFTSLIPEEDRQAVLADILSLTADSPSMTHDHKVIAPNGQVRWQRWTNRAIFDEQGHVVLLQSFGEDITEQKQTEEMLQTKNAAISASINGIAITDAEGDLVYVNQSFLDLWGYDDQKEVLGRNCLTFWRTPEEAARVVDVLQAKGGWIGELEAMKKDGSSMHVQVCATLVRDANGNARGMMSSFVDITEFKKTRESLRESEARLSVIFQKAVDGIVLIDVESGGFLDFNRAAHEQLGYTREEFQKLTVADIDAVESAGQVQEHIRAIIRKGSDSFETRHRTKYGRVRDVIVCTGGAVIDGRECVVGIWRDVTESKRHERELASYATKMVRAEHLASIGTLGATIAHELTQPLTVVRLSIQNALADLAKVSCPDDISEELEDSLVEISRVVSIIDRLRDLARQSTRGDAEQVSVRATAERVVRLFDEQAWRAKVTVHIEDVDGLPPIFINPRDLEQVFFALIQNALQAADGKKARKLTISGAVENGHIELRFSDDCGGIDKEALDRVFEPFFTTKPASQGTGLGLYVVEHMVSRAKGKVRVESEVGKGSTFYVTLPIKEHRRLQKNGNRGRDKETRILR